MNEFEICILAGGKSSRMGEDKGLMSLFGKPMISYVITELSKLGLPMTISSNNPAYKRFDLPVVNDTLKDIGPLGGIHSALSRTKSKKVIIVSCDVPYVTAELISDMMKDSEGFEVVLPSFDGQIHPLIGIYDSTILPHIQKQAELGNLKITLAIESLKLKLKDANDYEKINFKNLNSKSDIHA
ncbi:MAG: molybdopterin-guanine dinucleotide biosynthesis protein A [Arenicella sp.]|jgi:molybdopterin-guanine dinucleotide biosynthesis protein A